MLTLSNNDNLIVRYAMERARDGMTKGTNTPQISTIRDLQSNSNLILSNVAYTQSDGYKGQNTITEPTRFVSDGSDTYGDSEANSALELTSFSIGIWFKYKTPVNPFECLCSVHYDNTCYAKILTKNNDTLDLYPNANADNTGFISISGAVDDTLYYLGFSYDYTNGYTLVSINGGFLSDETNTMTIGSYSNPPSIRLFNDPCTAGREYSCELIEFQLWNTALSTDNFSTNYQVGYVWPERIQKKAVGTGIYTY